MSLDALIAELTRVADVEEAGIRANARARETEIRRASEAAIASRREAELARIGDEERRAVIRDMAGAERSNRQAVLLARAEVMTAVFGLAEQELGRAGGGRYGGAIPHLVRETLPYLEGRAAVLRCRPDVAPAVREASAGAVGVEVESAPDIEAGLLGETRDGVLQVDNRLVALLARRRDDLAIALARRLAEC